VKSYVLLFSRLFIRPAAQEPVRSALTVLAVALGVGVVIAIDLAGQAAAGSFHASLESLTGKGDLLLTTTAGIDERLLGTLVQLPYDLKFSPRIESFASIEGKGAALPFIGLDLIGAAQASNFDASGSASSSPLFTQENPIWVGPALGLHAGQHVKLLINDTFGYFTVAGVLKQSKAWQAESNVIVADIGLAQRVMRRQGRLDSIDVEIPSGSSIDSWRRKL